MGVVYLTHKNHRVDQSPLRGDKSTDHVISLPEEIARLRGMNRRFWGEEYSGDVLSLLEENARLRGLVVKLPNLILRKRR
jgi:hypothetical protein